MSVHVCMHVLTTNVAHELIHYYRVVILGNSLVLSACIEINNRVCVSETVV